MSGYRIWSGEREIGRAEVRQEGAWLCAELRCGREAAGLYRAFLRCARGEIPLGIMEEDGESLTLCRRIPAGEAERRGGIEGAEVRLSCAFGEAWRRAEAPFFSGERYGAAEEMWAGALWRKAGEGRLLAMPYDPGRPFPLVSLFCFARIMPVCGRCCAVFCFDGADRPVMEEKRD